MTKSEYREYIASEKWQKRRRLFLQTRDECERCGLPHATATIQYDQGLHVHHRNYLRVGAELDEDLEALCRRCHEIETFGFSDLESPESPGPLPIADAPQSAVEKAKQENAGGSVKWITSRVMVTRQFRENGPGNLTFAEWKAHEWDVQCLGEGLGKIIWDGREFKYYFCPLEGIALSWRSLLEIADFLSEQSYRRLSRRKGPPEEVSA